MCVGVVEGEVLSIVFLEVAKTFIGEILIQVAHTNIMVAIAEPTEAHIFSSSSSFFLLAALLDLLVLLLYNEMFRVMSY